MLFPSVFPTHDISFWNADGSFEHFVQKNKLYSFTIFIYNEHNRVVYTKTIDVNIKDTNKIDSIYSNSLIDLKENKFKLVVIDNTRYTTAEKTIAYPIVRVKFDPDETPIILSFSRFTTQNDRRAEITIPYLIHPIEIYFNQDTDRILL